MSALAWLVAGGVLEVLLVLAAFPPGKDRWGMTRRHYLLMVLAIPAFAMAYTFLDDGDRLSPAFYAWGFLLATAFILSVVLVVRGRALRVTELHAAGAALVMLALAFLFDGAARLAALVAAPALVAFAFLLAREPVGKAVKLGAFFVYSATLLAVFVPAVVAPRIFDLEAASWLDALVAGTLVMHALTVAMTGLSILVYDKHEKVPEVDAPAGAAGSSGLSPAARTAALFALAALVAVAMLAPAQAGWTLPALLAGVSLLDARGRIAPGAPAP